MRHPVAQIYAARIGIEQTCPWRCFLPSADVCVAGLVYSRAGLDRTLHDGRHRRQQRRRRLVLVHPSGQPPQLHRGAGEGAGPCPVDQPPQLGDPIERVVYLTADPGTLDRRPALRPCCPESFPADKQVLKLAFQGEELGLGVDVGGCRVAERVRTRLARISQTPLAICRVEPMSGGHGGDWVASGRFGPESIV